jgi:hypothetical protein
MSEAVLRNDPFSDPGEDRVRAAQPRRTDNPLLADLIAVLLANPAGLRRWSVMRAMRTRAEKANREVSPKFEDDVERVFRRHCTGDSVRASAGGDLVELFHRPKEKAGEVWAAIPQAAKAWLDGSGA